MQGQRENSVFAIGTPFFNKKGDKIYVYSLYDKTNLYQYMDGYRNLLGHGHKIIYSILQPVSMQPSTESPFPST